MVKLNKKYYEKKIAEEGLKLDAIKLNPDEPFQWASGYMMPIYNDNRMFLFYPSSRELIVDGFQHLIEEEKIPYDVIAGIATAGIIHGTGLADRLDCPFVYVREKSKGHGLKNRIEGIGAGKNLKGKKVIVIEDLISTGGSSVSAVEAIRDAKGEVDYCLSIFNYGLDKAVKAFGSLDPKCEVRSLLSYDILLKVAKKTGYLTRKQVRLLKEWRKDPFGWGDKNGFPKVMKPEDDFIIT